jgi:VanZ family protein
MGVIFTASGDVRSLQRSSRIIEPILRWLFPHLSEETVQMMVFFARKWAHLAEYALLALLVWRALRRPVRNDSRPWDWRQAFLALGFVVLYATSDEIHQVFVPSRQASVLDVLIDTTGGALGLLALWIIGKWLRIWAMKETTRIGGLGS